MINIDGLNSSYLAQGLGASVAKTTK